MIKVLGSNRYRTKLDSTGRLFPAVAGQHVQAYRASGNLKEVKALQAAVEQEPVLQLKTVYAFKEDGDKYRLGRVTGSSPEGGVSVHFFGITAAKAKHFKPAYIQPGPRMSHRVILTWSKHGAKKAKPWMGFGLELEDSVTGEQPIKFTTSKTQGALTTKSKRLLAGWTPIIQV